MQAATALQPKVSYSPYAYLEKDLSPGIFGCDAIMKTYGKRHDVFVQGDRKSAVYQVVSGMVCLYTILADGKRQIVDFALPGDIIGLGAAENYTSCAQTIGETRLKRLALSSIYERAAQSPMFGLALYRAISRELDATRDLLVTLGQLGAIERVATFLLVIAKRSAQTGNKLSNVLQLPMTRTDIADLLGLTIETVSRSLSRLRHRKLIEIIHNSEIRILDIEQLRDLAGIDQDAMAANEAGMDAVSWH